MPRPTRRRLLSVPLVAAVAPVSLDLVDTSDAEYSSCWHDLHSLARRWETTGPADAATVLADVRARAAVAGTGTVEWATLRAQACLMESEARDAMGDARTAAELALDARTLGARTGDAATRAHAELTLAVYAEDAAPTSATALALATKARQRSAGTYAAPLAAVTEAGILARQGATAGVVLGLLRQAEELRDVPLSSRPGYSLGSVHEGYLWAFGGGSLALVPGATVEARRWLDRAGQAFRAGEGVNVVMQVYRARAAMTEGAVDEAAAYAESAIRASGDGHPPAWLTNGVARLGRDARSRGARWELSEV